MATFADLLNLADKAKLQEIIENRKAAERAAWEERCRLEKEHTKKMHFKNAEEMIEWILSGKTMSCGRAKMELSKDGTHVRHFGQHSDEYDAVFWWGWTEQTVDDWKKWVYQISEPEHLEYGYLPVWHKDF